MVKDSVLENAPRRVPNAVTLQTAVLCAECEVISDSPHDRCLVCGSRSLFNIARIFGGTLPQKRTALIVAEQMPQPPTPERVLTFPKPHRLRRRATVDSRPLFALEEKSGEANGVSLGQKRY